MGRIVRQLLLLSLTLATSVTVFAQDILIANLSRTKGYFGDNIEISGSGFSTTVANMEVWFGAAKGAVVSSRANLLIATVPPGATTSSITVLNKASNLSASSAEIFYPIFQGDPSHDLSITNPTTFSNTNEVYDIHIVDLDLDGNNDMVVTKKDNTSTTIQIFRNTTTGGNVSFAETSVNLAVPTLRITSADIDGDGKKDLIVTQENHYTFFVLRNTSTTGTISFAAKKSYFIRPTQFIRGAAVKDIDLDGKPEVIISNTIDDEVSIFTNSSTPGTINLSFTPYRFTTGGKTAWELVAEDFNEDGKADIALVSSDNDVTVIPNNSSTGTIQMGTPVALPVTAALTGLEVGDINDDSKIDIIAVDFFNNELALFENESTRDEIKFAAVQKLTVGTFSNDITLTDYTGNGKLDIISTSAGTDNLDIFVNNSSGGSMSLAKTQIPQPLRSIFVVSGDLNDDGKSDLAMTSRDEAGLNFSVVVMPNTVCNKPQILTVGVDPPEICNGQTYLFSTPALPNTTYIWKKDGVEVQNSTDPTFGATTGGDYSVTAVNGSCSIESEAITLTINTGAIPNDPIASNNGPTCIGGSVTLESTTVTGASYVWTGPNDFTSTDQNPVLTNVTAAMAGTYYVKALVAPCESSFSETVVEVINPPDLSVSIDIAGKVCEGETITLTVGAAAGYNYQWYKDAALVAGATSNSLATTSPGSYTVSLKGVSNNCDLLSDPVVVEMFSPPSPTFSTTGTLCTGSVLTFTESTVLEPDKIPTFAWDFGDGNTSTEQNPSHSYATPADYLVQLVVGYEGHACNSTPISNSISINQPTAFTIDINGDNPFCEGDSVQLLVSSAGFNSVTWSTGESGFSIYGKEAGTITATAINTSGCESTSDIDITTSPAPIVTATADLDVISLGESVQLNASGTDSYLWSPPETLDDPTSATPLATPTESTTYTVTGTSINGCTAMADVAIEIKDTGEKLPITAPRMFSPNNDGINDTWVIENIQNFPDCELIIFSRSGKLVFETRGYSNTWDGRDANNSELPEGAYFYTISCDNGKSASGSVSIIR